MFFFLGTVILLRTMLSVLETVWPWSFSHLYETQYISLHFPRGSRLSPGGHRVGTSMKFLPWFVFVGSVGAFSGHKMLMMAAISVASQTQHFPTTAKYSNTRTRYKNWEITHSKLAIPLCLSLVSVSACPLSASRHMRSAILCCFVGKYVTAIHELLIPHTFRGHLNSFSYAEACAEFLKESDFTVELQEDVGYCQ